MKKTFPLSMIAFAILSSFAFAEEETLDKVVVTATEVKANEIKKTRKSIQEELINNSYDLVRYTTDVGISDNGRRTKGFAMRGVEGNRVSVSIDGVSLPDSEENSLYARYGNFNNSRLGIDPELVQGIDIMRGSDSFNSGSGALGGGVNYRTLDAADIVLPEQKWGVLLKNGYASKNREWTHTAGFAYKGDQFDATALYSSRHGHEMKSLGNGEDIYGYARGVPDPSKHKNGSYLFKAGYLFNDNHRLSASFNHQKGENLVDERSYSLLGLWREAKDFSERTSANLAYEYFPMNNAYLSYIKADLDWQNATVGAYGYKGSKIANTLYPASEIQLTKMKTDFKRAALRIDSAHFDTHFGSHQLIARVGMSEKIFKNSNDHTYYLDHDDDGSKEWKASATEAIQHPVRTRAWYAMLQDNTLWNNVFSSNIGVRYDWAQLVPQELNAICRACSDLPASNTFQSLSASLGVDAQLNNVWKVSYNISSGFRVPTASEMYFTYKHPAGSWYANPDLEAEQALNQSLSFQADHRLGTLGLTFYHSTYKNFLYEQERVLTVWNEHYDEYSAIYGQKPFVETLAQQMVNVDRARISGLEFNSKINLDQLYSKIPQGWKFIANLGYSKGKLKGTEDSLLSIQPVKAIVGIGYEDPEDKWGIQSRLTYLGAKKGKDAQITSYNSSTYAKTVSTYPYLNGSAVLVDLYGFAKLNKNITLRAGVYNLFNRKYHTWDILRGINKVSTTNAVDPDLKGLQRFYAPGRNFAGAVEIRF